MRKGPGWILAVVLAGGCAGEEPLERGTTALLNTMLAAEDARASGEAKAPLLAGTEWPDPEVRQIAVRALGRMERPAEVEHIMAALRDSNPAVRAEAANAIAQAVSVAGPSDTAASPLWEALGEESDPEVRGPLMAALGRLPYETPRHFETAASRLIGSPALPVGAGVTLAESTQAILGQARGLEALIRNAGQDWATSGEVVARLRELARNPAGTGDRDAGARVRRLAVAALHRAGALDEDLVGEALGDPDAEVRRLASAAISVDTPRRILDRALTDDEPRVRYEALRATRGRDDACADVELGLDDDNPHVRLLAVDLAASCPRLAPRLLRFADSLGTATTWHRPAHALVALAALDPPRARERLPLFTSAPTWQVRMYAARAAATLADDGALRRLSEDDVANVREAALRGLVATRPDDASDALVDALGSADYQLLITAANGLEGASNPRALEALVSALERVTEERRETSRDARRALLDRIDELGNADTAVRLESLLRDFDPAIAARAAEIIGGWRGTRASADPRPLAPIPVPTMAELEELGQARVVLTMGGGGVVTLRLLPYEAPTNAARFARLARAGYFDGLTFHRVVPNFVIQGGSPGANEYVGDGPYTRDEISRRSHLRGTVGISTRGRDTGDAQIFVNLVDNVRLDHGYTIFAEVVEGMDVIDAVLEGAVIDSVRLESTSTPGAGEE